MFSSSSSPLLQLSFSLLPFLSSELHAQLDVTLLLLPTRSGATAPPYAVVTYHSAALQAYWHCVVKY